ncbi:MAG: hypothetical protein Q4C75_04090 [Bergeyella zoohelcum]|nr:hypothetical protein [Bergeyella zoohelcum]
MKDLDILHFEQLKTEIQARYLANHTPSSNDISHWKGLDIVYFQEDLRKQAKGIISEKSFYTYFKNSPVSKLPRIDILNLLSVYAGYGSWYHFKKEHLFVNEILENLQDATEENAEQIEEETETIEAEPTEQKKVENKEEKNEEKGDLQKITTENQEDSEKETPSKNTWNKGLFYFGFSFFGVALFVILFFVVRNSLETKEFTYTFIDADRNTNIYMDLDVKIIKENESPILFKVKPNSPFIYKNPETKIMKMVVSSPYYKTDTIIRNLETAPENENIELKPNDYAVMLYYYSNSIKDIKRKRENLNRLINENALIYQVYDNETYGVETLDKQRYINLVTTPTTSLKNMEVIDTQMDKGKIVMIKFRISDETN